MYIAVFITTETMFTNRWMDKESIVIYTLHFSTHKEKWNHDICKKKKKEWNWRHYVKWNKPSSESPRLHFIACMCVSSQIWVCMCDVGRPWEGELLGWWGKVMDQVTSQHQLEVEAMGGKKSKKARWLLEEPHFICWSKNQLIRKPQRHTGGTTKNSAEQQNNLQMTAVAHSSKCWAAKAGDFCDLQFARLQSKNLSL